MKRALAAILAAGALAPSALAAAPTNAQLQAEIKALQARATKQDKLIKKLQTDVDNAGGLAATALVFSGCSTSIVADALQGTWAVIDQIALAEPAIAHTFFGPQVPIADPLNSCTLLKVTRLQPVPPTITTFSALYGVLRASTLAPSTSVRG